MMEACGAVSWPDGLVSASLFFSLLSFLDVLPGLGMLENDGFGGVVSLLV